MPPASHQVSATSLKLLIQQIHPHVRVERDSGMCVARGGGDGSGGGDGGGGSGGGALGGAALGSARAACGRARHIQRRVRSRALRKCCGDALARPLQRQHPAAWYFFSATRLPACSVELNALDRAHGLSFRRGLVKRKTSNSRWLATTALGPSPSSSSISAMRTPWPWPVLAFWKTEVACSGGGWGSCRRR